MQALAGAARRLGVSDTAIHKAERAGRIAREPDGQWGHPNAAGNRWTAERVREAVER